MTTELTSLSTWFWDRQDGWAQGADLIVDQTNGWDRGIQKAGFSSIAKTGECACVGFTIFFDLEIYKSPEHGFLIDLIELGLVRVPDTPSLMEWLRLYAPVIQTGLAVALKDTFSDLGELLMNEQYGVLADNVRARRNVIKAQRDYYRNQKAARDAAKKKAGAEAPARGTEENQAAGNS